jgi:rhodanese-related sulfurtransferase
LVRGDEPGSKCRRGERSAVTSASSIRPQEGSMPRRRYTGIAVALVVIGLTTTLPGQAPLTVRQAVVGGTGEKTSEISTEVLEAALAAGSAIVLDARPYAEFAVSHIPGAANVAPKPGVPMSMYVSDVEEIGRLVANNKAASLVLYCNGPHCGKSNRLAGELAAKGYTNVRRYQLGIPVWRALGNVCQIELEGIRYILANDATAVVIDSREPGEFRAGTLPAARNIARSVVLDGKDVGEVKRAKDDGRLPMKDHNTRIIVVGADAAAARHVAEALTREAFHNVSYFAGPFETVRAVVPSSALPR